MSGPPRVDWNQPVCAECWEIRYGAGRRPTRLRESVREVCAVCGTETWAGIYVRDRPASWKHPTRMRDA